MKIGHYDVHSKIGEGSSSTVYKAFDQRVSRWVAIKVLHYQDHDDIVREARLLASIHHPHVVTLLDVESFDCQTALVMEYLDGKTLAERITKAPLTRHQILEYALEIAKGLHAIHKAGLVHQDLKAENIYFDSENRLKIGDLGIAKAITEQSPTLTAGSVLALSPEQIQQGHVGVSSDLFSLGVLMYCMVMQAHPFGNDRSATKNIVENIVSKTPQPLNSGCRELDELIVKLLNKAPDGRPQSAMVVISQLKQILAKDQFNQTLSFDKSTFESTSYKGTNRTVKHRIFWLFMGIVITVLCTVGWLKWYTLPDEPHYVAVLRPDVYSNSEIVDLPLIQASVYQASLQVFNDLDSVKMVAADEVDGFSQTPENIREIKNVTASDEVFYTQMDCQKSQCAIIFSRWQGDPIVLTDQQHMQIPTDRLLFINDSVQRFLQNWLGNKLETEIISSFQSESVMRQIITTRIAYQTKQITLSEYVNTLESIPNNKCSVGEICSFLLQAYRAKYSLKKESIWLEKASELVANTSEPSNQLIYYLAEFYLSAQQFDDADRLLKQLEMNHSVDELIKSLRARWFFSQGLTVKGKALLSELVEERPGAKHLFNYALMLFKTGEMDGSHEVLDTLFQRVPNHIKGLELNGILEYYNGNWEKVIATYETLISLNRGDTPITQSNIGFAYMMRSEGQLALMHLRRAYELSPDNPQVLINLADAEKLYGDETRANQYYQQVISNVSMIEKRAKIDSLVLAQAYAHTNQRKLAEDVLWDIERHAIQDPSTFYYLSLVYSLLGEDSAARSYHIKAVDNGVPAEWFDMVWFKLND